MAVTTVTTAFAAAVTAFSNASGAASLLAPGIYNGSCLPSGTNLPWNTYNYCNAPHVNAEHYPRAPPHSELVYVTSFQRHAKRTPDNLLPGIDAERVANPPGGWDCATDYELLSSASGDGSQGVEMETTYSIPSWHPLGGRLWNGSCSSGQLTRGGWEDAHTHGKDFMAVYGPGGPAQILGSGEEACNFIVVRASPSARTAQVASAFLSGMGICGRDAPKKLIVQPDTIDGIVPSYSCLHTDSLRTAIEATPAWKQHLADHAHVFDPLHASLPTTKNVTAWNWWIDHSFDALASRQCHGHPLPRGAEDAPRVSQATADEVYAMGDWEYDYIWNRASANGTGDLADEYVRYGSAVLVDELVRNLKTVAAAHTAGGQAQSTPRVKLFVGHDGTMVRLLKTLAQSGSIRWPAMGSEVVIEVWRQDDCGDEKKKEQQDKGATQASRLFVRIFAYGTLLKTDAEKLRPRGGNSTTPAPRSSSQSGLVEWTPLEDVIEYLAARIPVDLVEKCAPQISS